MLFRSHKEMNTEEAMEYMLKNDMCNPHQMVRTEDKMKIRTDFMRVFFDKCKVFMVNTTTPAEETQERIRQPIM